MFSLSHSLVMQQVAMACPGPVVETISGWGQYSSQLQPAQQATVNKLADLIVSSFAQFACPPFRDASAVGHADKDWHGEKVEDRVSFERAMTVQKALTAAVLKLWADRNMGPPPSGGIDWEAHGEGSKKMIAPPFHSANRRVVVTLARKGALLPPPQVSNLVSPRGTPINPKRTGKMINIFGENETEPGFVNYTTELKWAMGRPWTADPQQPPGLADKSASDICLRSSPMSKVTLDEMERIAMPGARITIALNTDPKTDDNPGSTNSQLQKFRDKFPNRTTLFDGVHHGVFEGNGAAVDWKVIVVELP